MKIEKEKREEEKHKDKNKGRQKNKTEAFHSFFQFIIPHIKEIWTDRCIDGNTPQNLMHSQKGSHNCIQ